MHKYVVGLSLSIALLNAKSLTAENWPQWRGSSQDGVVTGTDYPTVWGEEQNIVWKVQLPGWGTSTPAIWGEQIFVTCADEEANRNAVVCLNRAGQQLWKTSFGPLSQSRNRKASGANPSPTTDGTHVFAYFKNGDLACVDFSGKVVWQTNLQERYVRDMHNWDLGTSPVLTQRSVVVAIMHQGPSYLLAFDKETGNEAWKQSRDLGAPAESRDSYSTPLVLEHNGQEVLVVLGADHVTVHRAETGEELSRVGNLNPNRQGNWRSIASPVAAAGMVFVPYARGETLTAIELGGQGDVTQSHVPWAIDSSSGDVPSPTVLDGRVYLCGDRGDVSCIDLQSARHL